MNFPLENRVLYALLALLVLAVFYGIYFIKILAQKQRGIQTRQIGRRKEKSIHTVEVLMSIATLGAPIAQLLSIAFGWSHLPAGARFTGFCVGMLGDIIFLLSVLCMKDSGRVFPTRMKRSWLRPAFTVSAATRRFSALTSCMSASCCCTETC